MKAVILAAGRGRRMGNLTKDLPKPLVQIKERPFLYFLIKNIHAAGINSIGIVVGHKKEKIAEFVKKHGINPILIEQKKPLGTGDAVKAAEKFAGSDSIIVLNGDSIYSAEDIKRIMRVDEYCYVAGLESKHPERYGVIINRDDSVVKIIEKPEIFVGNMINAGIYRFTSEIFDALKKIKLSPRGNMR